jgi:hypothetical protein
VAVNAQGGDISSTYNSLTSNTIMMDGRLHWL